MRLVRKKEIDSEAKCKGCIFANIHFCDLTNAKARDSFPCVERKDSKTQNYIFTLEKDLIK